MWSTVIISFLALACIIVGMLLVFDKLTPFQVETVDADGKKVMEKAPLTRKEKGIVAAFTGMFVLMFVSLLAIFNPPWLDKLRAKLNGNNNK